MIPLYPQGDYVPIAFTRDGRAKLMDTALTFPLNSIRLLGQERNAQAAVTYDPELQVHMIFDMAGLVATPEPPYCVATRWWMALSKSRAIAQALWFARDERSAA